MEEGSLGLVIVIAVVVLIAYIVLKKYDLF